jgi:hypothetical protein
LILGASAIERVNDGFQFLQAGDLSHSLRRRSIACPNAHCPGDGISVGVAVLFNGPVLSALSEQRLVNPSKEQIVTRRAAQRHQPGRRLQIKKHEQIYLRFWQG